MELPLYQPILSRRTRGLARAFSIVCLVGAVILPALVLFTWLLPLEGASVAVANQTGSSSMEWFTTPLRGGAAAIALSTTAITAFGLIRLARFFRYCADDDLRSPNALAGFRDFGWAMFAEALLAPLQRGALEAYLTGFAPDTPGRLPLLFGSAELSKLFLAALIAFVAILLHSARRTQSELDSFV